VLEEHITRYKQQTGLKETDLAYEELIQWGRGED